MPYDENKRPTPRRVESTRTSQQRSSQRSGSQNRYTSSAEKRANSGSRASARPYESSQHYEEVRYDVPRQYREAMRYNAQQSYGNQQPYSQQSYADVSKYKDLSRYSSASGNNGGNGSQGAITQSKNRAPLIAGIVVAVLIIGALLWFFVIPKPFDVTVNGKTVTMKPGSTVASLVEEGYAKPTPGNLVAVDGSLITVGEGEKLSATINDSKATADTKLAKDMVVEISDGGDLTEEFTSSEEVVPFGTVNDDMSFEAYWAGSIHELSDGVDGLRTVKTGSISGKTVSEDTVPAVAGGYHNYTVQTDQPVIALTFDDGPWPESTNEVLDILEANGAKATFFTIGEQIQEQPDAVKRANDMGCEVLTHSWDHASGSGQGVDLTLMSSDEQIAEVTQGYAAIANVLGKEPAHIMRAPGGNFHDDIIMTLWPYLDAEIGWDVDTQDWAQPGVDAIVSRILSVEPGQVILMHDGGGDRAQTIAALRQALPTLVERGYKCVTISELLSYNKANTAPAAQQQSQEPAIEQVDMEEDYEEE